MTKVIFVIMPNVLLLWTNFSAWQRRRIGGNGWKLERWPR